MDFCWGHEAVYRSLKLCVLIAKELNLLQDWKTERYKEIIKSGTVRTSDFVGRKVFCFLFF